MISARDLPPPLPPSTHTQARAHYLALFVDFKGVKRVVKLPKNSCGTPFFINSWTCLWVKLSFSEISSLNRHIGITDHTICNSSFVVHYPGAVLHVNHEWLALKSFCLLHFDLICLFWISLFLNLHLLFAACIVALDFFISDMSNWVVKSYPIFWLLWW